MIPQIPGEPRENRLREIASQFTYPRTPDLGAAVVFRVSARQRPRVHAWQVALIVVLLGLAALLSSPQARALLSGYFRIGPVRILPFRPTPTDTRSPTVTPRPSPVSPTAAAQSATPSPSATAEPTPVGLRGLAGRTSLKDALDHAPFAVLLPAYPADLGQPDYVFYQPDVPMVILAWSEPSDPSKLRLSLYAIDSNSPMISKFEPEIIQETAVNGQYALWVRGPYLLELDNGDFDLRRLVDGNTLIWQVKQVTYRLESGLPLAEAKKIAESLRRLEP